MTPPAEQVEVAAPAEGLAVLEMTSAGFSCTGTERPVCISEGPVFLTAGASGRELRAEAARARFDGASRTLTLTTGWMQTGSSPRVDFDTATLAGVNLSGAADGHATVTWTGVRFRKGDAVLWAREATGAPDGPWRAEDLIYAPCTCPDEWPTAVTVAAREAELFPNFVLVKGGAIRLFKVPLIPLPPLRIPLNPDRFRLLVPEVGYGTPGFSANLRGQWGWEDWRMAGGPAWRQDRGGRLELDAKGPKPGLDLLGGQAFGALGWDAPTSTVRGAVSSTAGVVMDTAPNLRAAWDVDWQTDVAYAEDYGLDWVARGVPRLEQRAVLGLGPARWFVHGVSPAQDGSPGVVQGAEARVRRGWELGGSVVGLRAAVGGTGAQGGALSPLGELGLDASGGWALGPIRTGGALDVAGQGVLGSGGGELVGLARGRATVEVPMWTGRLQLWPGLLGEAHGDGQWDPSTPLGTIDERGFVGAGSRADLTSGAWLFAASAHAGQDERGWTGRATLDVDGPLDVALRLGRREQAGQVGFGSRVFSLAVGSAHDAPSWVGWTSTDVRIARLRLGGSLSTPLDVTVPQWSAGLLAGYDDGCSRLLVTAGLAPDRALPDVGLQFEVRR